MKKTIFFIFFFVSVLASAQKTINDYQYAIVPVKFDWMSKDNQYRVSTIVKMQLNELGFKAYYDNEAVPEEVASGRCDKLYIDVERTSSFLATKLIVIFKDCQNGIVLKSNSGVSKKKDFEEAYRDALTDAFKSVIALNYKYSGQPAAIVEKKPEIKEMPIKEKIVAETVIVPETKSVTLSPGKMSIEATAHGYIVIDDNTSTVKFKLSKTTNPDVFIATSQGRQGVLLKKASHWFFEYYQNDQLVSEQTDLKL